MKTPARSETILNNHYFWVLLITLLTFAFYYPALLGDLTNWDDLVYIKDNPFIKALSAENLSAIFSTNYMGNYHPLAMLSLTIDYQLYGFNPFGFHLTNLFLHILNSLLLLFILKELTGKMLIGAFAALIFGVHAFHVESVAWISERKDVLYTF